MPTAVFIVAFYPLSMPLPVVHTGWPVFLTIATFLLVAWIVCVLLVAAGVGLGHLLVLALRTLVTTFVGRDHNPPSTPVQAEPSADPSGHGPGQRTNDEIRPP